VKKETVHKQTNSPTYFVFFTWTLKDCNFHCCQIFQRSLAEVSEKLEKFGHLPNIVEIQVFRGKNPVHCHYIFFAHYLQYENFKEKKTIIWFLLYIITKIFSGLLNRIFGLQLFAKFSNLRPSKFFSTEHLWGPCLIYLAENLAFRQMWPFF
jgi:hypothetical protein